MLPDLDVVAFSLGIAYGNILGHRGITHSLAFALVLSAAVAAIACRPPALQAMRLRVWLFLFAATASHGLLDAFTDGGRGIALLAPFSAARWFFPWRPIEVSPIGAAFFSQWGLDVLRSELIWIWLPCALLTILSWLLRPAHRRSRHGDVLR